MYRYRSIEKQPSDGDRNIEYPIRVLWMLEECQSFRWATCWPRGVSLELWFILPLGWRQAVNSVLGEAKTHKRLCPTTAVYSKQSNVHH